MNDLAVPLQSKPSFIDPTAPSPSPDQKVTADATDFTAALFRKI
jgi:hypothetical protein